MKCAMDIDERFIKATLDVRQNSPPTREALNDLSREFQNMKVVALKTTEHNAYLAGTAATSKHDTDPLCTDTRRSYIESNSFESAAFFFLRSALTSVGFTFDRVHLLGLQKFFCQTANVLWSSCTLTRLQATIWLRHRGALGTSESIAKRSRIPQHSVCIQGRRLSWKACALVVYPH